MHRLPRLASVLLLLFLPAPLAAVSCYDCQGCAVAPTDLTAEERRNQCEACFKIEIRTDSGDTVRRTCGNVGCHKSPQMDIRRNLYAMEVATNENGGVRPIKWKAHCCNDDRCNDATRLVGSWLPLLLVVVVLGRLV